MKTLFFDLDGTLTDPAEGITNSICYALEKYGITIEHREQLYCFIGPPLWESFVKYFEFSEEQAHEAVAYYREYFSVKGLYENKVYPGIQEMLETLQQKGVPMVLATSKPTVYAEQILKHFQLDSYFTFVSGSELDGSRILKKDVILYAMNTLNLNANDIIMIGDRKHDMIGANECDIANVGVLYGYGDYEELRDAGANFIVRTPQELNRILSNMEN